MNKFPTIIVIIVITLWYQYNIAILVSWNQPNAIAEYYVATACKYDDDADADDDDDADD